MHHTTPWYLPWGLKLVPLSLPPGHPASGIPNPALHLLAPLPGIYAPEPRKVRDDEELWVCELDWVVPWLGLGDDVGLQSRRVIY